MGLYLWMRLQKADGGVFFKKDRRNKITVIQKSILQLNLQGCKHLMFFFFNLFNILFAHAHALCLCIFSRIDSVEVGRLQKTQMHCGIFAFLAKTVVAAPEVVVVEL